MEIQSGNIQEKLNQIEEHWSPHIIGELNNQQVKLAKLKGEFVWHKHDLEDELFLIIEGSLSIAFRDGTKHFVKNDFVIIPKGLEHKPYCKEEVSVLLFEPATTLNTGNMAGHLTKKKLKRI